MPKSHAAPKFPAKTAPLVDDDDDVFAAPVADAAPAAAAAAAAAAVPAPVAGQRRVRSTSAASPAVATPSPAILRSVEGAAVGHRVSSAPPTPSPAPSTPVAKARGYKPDPEVEAAKVTALCKSYAFLTLFDKQGKPDAELFRTCKRDLVEHYEAFAYCTACAEGGRLHHNSWFVRGDALRAHVAQYHSGGDAAAAAAVGTPDALRSAVRTTFALWAASAGLADVHVKRFGDLFGSRLALAPVPMAQRGIVSYERVIADGADVSDACVKRLLKKEPFVAVSFDGGRWQHKGQYMLVTVAHSPSGMFVLRPHTSETPYDGKAIAECFTSTLHAVGAPILHAMVDGCTANEAGLKGVELLAQELAAVDLNSDEDEAAGEGVEDNEEKRRSALERLAETLRDVNMLEHASRYPKRLLCIAHWLKNRVLELQKGLSSDGMTAVSLLTKALFSPDGSCVRKGQLRRFIRDRRVHLTKNNASALIALADDILLLLRAMRAEDPEGAEGTFASVKGGLMKEMATIQGDELTLAAIQRLEFGDANASELLRLARQRLIAAASATRVTPRAVRIATTNQTRWHSSVFASFACLLEYLSYVRDFFSQPEKQTSQSAKELHRMLSNPETFNNIANDLRRYTSSLEPMAALMTSISDVSATRPMAHKMHLLYDQMRKRLAQQPADTPGRLLASVLDEYESPDKRVDEKFSATLETFWYVKLFVPATLIARGDMYKARLAKGKLRAGFVRMVFGFAESEFPEVEWDLWNDGIREEVEDPDAQYHENPSLYWASDEAKARFPTLHKAALYVLSLPVAVTSCDSVISVMGATFSTRQNALSVMKSSALLAYRCNGDIEQRSLDPSTFPRWGARGGSAKTDS